jgi:hypothetical protein
MKDETVELVLVIPIDKHEDVISLIGDFWLYLLPRSQACCLGSVALWLYLLPKGRTWDSAFCWFLVTPIAKTSESCAFHPCALVIPIAKKLELRILDSLLFGYTYCQKVRLSPSGFADWLHVFPKTERNECTYIASAFPSAHLAI